MVKKRIYTGWLDIEQDELTLGAKFPHEFETVIEINDSKTFGNSAKKIKTISQERVSHDYSYRLREYILMNNELHFRGAKDLFKDEYYSKLNELEKELEVNDSFTLEY